jgi:hypothetical protein
LVTPVFAVVCAVFAVERALEAVVEAVVAVAWRLTQSVAVSTGKTFNFEDDPAA